MGFNFSFRGVHPPDNKHFTENKPIETAKVLSGIYTTSTTYWRTL